MLITSFTVRKKNRLSQSDKMFRNLFAVLLAMMTLVGCGKRPPGEQTRASAESSLVEARELLEQEQFEQAESKFALALEGNLRADAFVDAASGRAQCLAEMDRFDEAMEMIEKVRNGLESEAVYHLEVGKIYLAKGEKANAKSEFAKARKIDRRIKIPRS